MRAFGWAVAVAAIVLAAAGPAMAQATPAAVPGTATPAAAATPPAPAAPVEDRRPKTHALLGKPLPAFTAAPLDGGKALTEKDLKGQWTVVLFWGVWCGDCQRDADYTFALARAIAADKSLAFKTVHVDTRTGRFPSIDAYFESKGERYPTWLDADRTVYKAFQMQWVPTYLVVDPQGVVRAHRTDLSKDTSPEGGVKAFLKEIAALKAA